MTDTARPVDALSDQYVDRYCALDPCTATYVGVPGHDHRLTDFSPDAQQERADLARSVLRDLGRTTPVDRLEEVAAAQLQERLQVELDRYDSGWVQADLNTVDSPLQGLKSVFDLMPTATADDWDTVASRLSGIPTALGGLRVSLAEAANAGQLSAARQVRECARRARTWSGMGATPSYFGRLVERGDTDGALRRRLDQGAAEANAAFASFASWLEDDLLPTAPQRDAFGAERYALASRVFTGARLDLAETYAWGWEELARIEREMAATARELGADDVEAAVRALDADPARQLRGAGELQAWLQETSDAALEALAGVHFDVPDPVRRLECRISPSAGDGMYYTGPSEDFSRPGRMWWSLPEGSDVHGTWREKTTVYHEGVPGHHLQVAQTAFRSGRLNRFQRLLCWVSGHGEGWALYAERLMQELGFLDEPGDRMGLLDSQAFRAARVVLDIGLHLELELPRGAGMHEGERWDAAIGLEFLRAHTHMDDQLRIDEIDRYLGWAGQAPSYKVGERVWLECREQARARPGFDLKTWHRQALDLGSMGLDPLRAELARI